VTLFVPCEVDPDRWFDARTTDREAAALCAGCPALEGCRAYALKHGEEFGVWGGLTEQGRRDIKAGRTVRRQAKKPGPPSEEDLRLWSASEVLVAEGSTVIAAAEQLGVTVNRLKHARRRSRYAREAS
jgi:hypothetical protein